MIQRCLGSRGCHPTRALTLPAGRDHSGGDGREVVLVALLVRFPMLRYGLANGEGTIWHGAILLSTSAGRPRAHPCLDRPTALVLPSPGAGQAPLALRPAGHRHLHASVRPRDGPVL